MLIQYFWCWSHLKRHKWVVVREWDSPYVHYKRHRCAICGCDKISSQGGIAHWVLATIIVILVFAVLGVFLWQQA